MARKKEELQIDRLEFEKRLWAEGYGLIAGVDEAGRGPVAGPIYAAAVILDPEVPIEGLTDSKQLTPRQREALFPVIQEKALSWCISSVSAAEIDLIGINPANVRVMQEAIRGLDRRPDYVLTDFVKLPDLDCPYEGITKGDFLSASIAAASILAKVARDHYMTEADRLYPGYGFAGHKGYGTAAHREALSSLGLSPEHRLCFLHKWGYGN